MSKSTKAPPQELTEGDRLRIGHARAVLQEYGLYVDVAEMSDVAYEQRQVRMKAMDLAVQCCAASQFKGSSDPVTTVATEFYDYIWKGTK